jgi:hypothetical protein
MKKRSATENLGVGKRGGCRILKYHLVCRRQANFLKGTDSCQCKTSRDSKSHYTPEVVQLISSLVLVRVATTQPCGVYRLQL